MFSFYLFLFSSSIRKWWFDCRKRSPNGCDARLPQWESDYHLHQEQEFRMFYEYLDMGKKSYCKITTAHHNFFNSLMKVTFTNA